MTPQPAAATNAAAEEGRTNMRDRRRDKAAKVCGRRVEGSLDRSATDKHVRQMLPANAVTRPSSHTCNPLNALSV